MLVVFTAKDRIALLPYFFRYYLSIGATRFLCCLYRGQKNPLYPAIENWRNYLDLKIQSTGDFDVEAYCGPSEAAAVERIRATLTDPWHVIADLDEFYWLPPGTTLQNMVVKLEAGKYTAASCHLIDRIAEDGSLAPPGAMLDITYPLAFNLTQAIGACPNKIAIVSARTPLQSGHHNVADGSPTLAWGEFHHFKWLPGIIELLVERSVYFTRLGLPWAAEGWRTAGMFIDGKLDLKNPAIKTWLAPPVGV